MWKVLPDGLDKDKNKGILRSSNQVDPILLGSAVPITTSAGNEMVVPVVNINIGKNTATKNRGNNSIGQLDNFVPNKNK